MDHKGDSQKDTQLSSQPDAYPIAKRKHLDVLPDIPTELKPNDLYYSMKRPERGLAVIFNHEFYDEIDGEKPENRHGTNADVENLNITLSNLGFVVDVQHNLTCAEILGHVGQISKRDELRDHDCFAVFVLSHGDEQEFVYARDRAYYIKLLTEPFIGKNCLQLANKPKLFFIQACKGIRLQSKINFRTMADSGKMNGAGNSKTVYSIPADSDILISYATLEGYIALRDPTWGTPFIMALCDELNNNGTTLDLLQILIRVHHRLATSTYVLQEKNTLVKVQPSFLCYLNRFVRFDTPTLFKSQTQ
ncbi:caspase-1-like isoform X2 [Periplaneta americana]